MQGSPVVVPVLWALEVSNALLMLMRRGKMTPIHWTRALHQISLLELTIDEEAIRLATTEISSLASKYSLTTYDATYLELAIRRGLPLASRDAALNKAARKCRVKTLL